MSDPQHEHSEHTAQGAGASSGASSAGHSDAQAQAEAIAGDAEAKAGDVRRRISDLIASAAATPGRALEGGANALQRLVGEVLEGASRGARTLSQERQNSVMAETLEGLGEGLGKAAHATKLALEEARGRGESFAKDDVRAAIDDLRAIEDLLRESASRLARSTGRNASGLAEDLSRHAQNVFESIRPSVESALREAMRHPVAFAADAAATGVDAARLGVGALFEAAGGLLSNAGQSLSGKRKDGPSNPG
ncbi:MAG: hypothetical protein KatS3mg103_1076 [Phycisphaerales bacterium]|nr:MAG: hypothetical protein KatS3mg103_1076 [Phycisphaerales bacterium]